jgi:hypothetical protein
LRQIQLGLEQIPIRVERVELRVDSAAIAHIGEPQTVLQDDYQLLLLNAALAHPLMGDQRVGYFGERRLNCLLVLDQRLVALRLGEPDVALQPPRREDRLRDLRNQAPGAAWTAEQT